MDLAIYLVHAVYLLFVLCPGSCDNIWTFETQKIQVLSGQELN